MDTQTSQVTTEAIEDAKKPSLLKQLVGAGAGMMVALALYNAYTFTSPYATPYLQASIAYLYPPGTSVTNPPSSDVRFSDKTISSDSAQFAKVGARARDIAKRLGPSGGTEESTSFEVTMPEVTEKATSSSISVMEESSSSEADVLPVTPEEGDAKIEAAVLEEASSSSAETIATAHTGAPKLPSSGVGMWTAVLIAFGGATFMMPKMRKWIVER